MMGAQTLVEMLKQYQVEVIFGVPGDTSILLYEALYDAQPGIRHIMARDERSASFMADAYARLSHKPGICDPQRGRFPLFDSRRCRSQRVVYTSDPVDHGHPPGR